MLNVILIYVQYSQKAVLAFKKVRIVEVTPPEVLSPQYKNPPGKILIPPNRGELTAIWKTLIRPLFP